MIEALKFSLLVPIYKSFGLLNDLHRNLFWMNALLLLLSDFFIDFIYFVLKISLVESIHKIIRLLSDLLRKSSNPFSLSALLLLLINPSPFIETRYYPFWLFERWFFSVQVHKLLSNPILLDFFLLFWFINLFADLSYY